MYLYQKYKINIFFFQISPHLFKCSEIRIVSIIIIVIIIIYIIIIIDNNYGLIK